MSAFEQIFGRYAESQLHYLAKGPHQHPVADWRTFERRLIDYLESYHIDVINEAGTPVIEVVRFREGEEEVVTARVSLEHLARFLAREIGR
jgi:hypothetical protein